MKPQHPIRNGITLIELLVVITIMMILASVVLPQLDFGNEKHKNRESARIISTYLSAARNKAIETARPCGVLFQRSGDQIDTDGDGTDDTTPMSVQMIQVQMPTAYAGEDMDSYVTVTNAHNATFSTPATVSIAVDDHIQFDYQGPWYRIDSVTPGALPDTIASIHFEVLTGVPVKPWTGQNVSFQIRRQPVLQTGPMARSLTPPQRLLAGTAVDFTASGIGNTFFHGTGPVAIIFDSNGAVQSVIGLAGIDTPIEPIYLLVGQEMHVPNGLLGNPDTTVPWYQPNVENEEDAIPNWQISESRWVVINPSTGIATVAENMTVGDTEWTHSNPATLPEVQNASTGAIPEARKIAREGLDQGD